MSVFLKAALKQHALEMGFDLVGIAPLNAWEDLEFSRQWVERGYGGEMRYLENPKRDDPRRVLPSAQSVICVGLVYNAPLPYSTEVRDVRWPSSMVRCNSPEPLETPRPRVAKSDSYGQRTTDNGPDGGIPRAWISRYAWGRDYHDVMRAKLEKLRVAIEGLAPGVQTGIYVDTGPIVERAFARLSGIGWAGKNTCLINEQKGSWFFLGVVLTSLALEPDLPAPDRCGSCTRCIEACPTGALVEPYVMDASRCIAYFNIELKGSIPPEFRPAIGANVFGCDICQDVSPWNNRRPSFPQSGISGQLSTEPVPQGRRNATQGVRPGRMEGAKSDRSAPLTRWASEGPGVNGAATTTLSEFQPLQVTFDLRVPSPQPLAPNLESRTPIPEPRAFSLFNPPLEALAAMSEHEFRRIFRHSPVKRVKYRGWLRNLCVAMGNSRDPRFVGKLEELSQHNDPVVREHAEWALKRLSPETGNRQITDVPRN